MVFSVKTAVVVLLKSLFYEGNFNATNMQGTGFSWIVRPFLKDKLSEEDSLKLYGYFNTNPTFITVVTNVFIHEYLRKERDPFMIKNMYSSAFAALGDAFFWRALRPFLFLLSLYVTLYVSVFGIFIYPLVYTTVGLFFLIAGWIVGGIMKSDVIMLFSNIKFNHWADLLDKFSTFMLGLLLVKFVKDGAQISVWFLASGIAAFLVGFLIYKHVRITWFVIGLSALIAISVAIYGGYGLWKIL